MANYIGRTLKGHGRVVLSDEPLGRGGEGSVFAVMQHDVPDLPVAANIVAKIYHDPSEGNRKNKTAAMLKNPPHSDSVAWPLGILFTPDKQFAGYVMVKLDNTKYRQWSELANAADRRETSPHFDVMYGLTAAKNLAVAIDSIHDAGHRVGDVNESNIFVGTDATVLIVDTDSAQIRSGERQYNCLVGKPDYTAPELIGGTLRDKERTRETDMFAYAVAIYQMLTGGFHPTDGVYQGDDMPPDFSKKIRMGSYPSLLGENAQFKPNPRIPADALPLSVRNLILDALSDNPAQRPTFDEFVDTLHATLEDLQQCTVESNHWYNKSATQCPWCAHAEATRVDPWAVTPVVPARPTASQTSLPALSFEEDDEPVKARRAPIQRGPQAHPAQPSHAAPGGSSGVPGQAPQQAHGAAPSAGYPYPGYPGAYPGQFPGYPGHQQAPPPAEPDIPDTIKGKTVLKYKDGSWDVRPKLSLLMKANPKLAIHCIKTETPRPFRFWWTVDRDLPHMIGLFVGLILGLLLSASWYVVAQWGYDTLVATYGWSLPAFVPEYVIPILGIVSVAVSVYTVTSLFVSGLLQHFKAKKQGGGSVEQFKHDNPFITVLRYLPLVIVFGAPAILIAVTGLVFMGINMLIDAFSNSAGIR